MIRELLVVLVFFLAGVGTGSLLGDAVDALAPPPAWRQLWGPAECFPGQYIGASSDRQPVILFRCPDGSVAGWSFR